jgi:hypothetical protein
VWCKVHIGDQGVALISLFSALEPALTVVGVSGITLLVLIFLKVGRKLPFGVLSLPSIMALTSITYFYLMPLVLIANNQNNFFGIELTTLEPIHAAAMLYSIGAALAFRVFSVYLRSDPSEHRSDERKLNPIVFWVLFALAIIGMSTQVALGQFNLTNRDDYLIDFSVGNLAFLSLSYSLMIPLTLVILIRKNFNLLSLLLLVMVLFVFLTLGSRFRIVILLCGAASSFILIRKIKLGFFRTALGIMLMLSFINLVGLTRNYYRGIDLSAISDVNFLESMFMFEGEAGMVFTLSHIASSPPDKLILFDPWIVGISRLIPSFLLEEKPFPEYLFLYPAGFLDSAAMESGVSAPQHAELLLQFGWIGLPFLAFCYFCIAGYTVNRLQHLGREARIAGCAIVPTLFGFYMQQRGYFFQLLCEYIFTIMPLFLLYYQTGRVKTSRRMPWSSPLADQPVGEKKPRYEVSFMPRRET